MSEKEEKTGSVLSLESYKTNKNIELRDAHKNIYESYSITRFETSREYKRLVKKAVRLARSSEQYNYYIANLISERNIDSCFLLNNITTEHASIEMHHYPFTIYDICDIVATKRLYRKEQLTSISVAKEVMQLHFMHVIGLVPCSLTVHQLAHSGAIFIPLTANVSDVQLFVDQYKEYINPVLLEKYNKLVEKTENNDEVDFENRLVVKPIKWSVKENQIDGNLL